MAVDDLEPRLREVDRVTRAIFATSCAATLLPLYEQYERFTGRGDSAALTKVRDYLWSAIETEVAPSSIGDQIDKCFSLVLDEDDDAWNDLTAVANNAAAATGYAAKAFSSGKAGDALWAAVQVHEALDYMQSLGDGQSPSLDEVVKWQIDDLLLVSDGDRSLGERVARAQESSKNRAELIRGVWSSFLGRTPFAFAARE